MDSSYRQSRSSRDRGDRESSSNRDRDRDRDRDRSERGHRSSNRGSRTPSTAAPPPRGSHNRPWQAEDEYIQLTKQRGSERRSVPSLSTIERFSQSDSHMRMARDSRLHSSDPRLNTTEELADYYLQQYDDQEDALKEEAARRKQSRQRRPSSLTERTGDSKDRDREGGRSSSSNKSARTSRTSAFHDSYESSRDRDDRYRSSSSRDTRTSGGGGEAHSSTQKSPKTKLQQDRHRRHEQSGLSNSSNEMSIRRVSTTEGGKKAAASSKSKPKSSIQQEVESFLRRSKTSDQNDDEAHASPRSRRHHTVRENRTVAPPDRSEGISRSHSSTMNRRSGYRDRDRDPPKSPRASSKTGLPPSGGGVGGSNNDVTESPETSAPASLTSRELRTRRLRQDKERQQKIISDSTSVSSGVNATGSNNSGRPLTSLEQSAAKREQLANRTRQVQDEMQQPQAGGGTNEPRRTVQDMVAEAKAAATTSVATTLNASRAAVAATVRDKNVGRPEPSAMKTTVTGSAPAPAASTGWPTLTSRRKVEQSPSTAPPATSAATSTTSSTMSKVNQYLQQRSNTIGSAGHGIGSGIASSNGTGITAATGSITGNMLLSGMRKSTSNPSLSEIDSIKAATNAAHTAVAVSSFDMSSDDESSSSDEDYDDEVSSSSDEDGSGGGGSEWSVRVCVVSAVDFPQNAVPNLPLSPVIRLGLVKLPPQQSSPTTENSKAIVDAHKKQLMNAMSQGGLLSVPKSRVRCTCPKILSKRDNGSVEFHEEIRWDRVRQPEQVALAVELSSRAVMTPKNIKESPPSQKIEPPRVTTAGGLGRPSSLKLSQSARPVSLGSSTAGQGGLDSSEVVSGLSGSIGSLFSRRTAKKPAAGGKAEMETAQAAAVVAKLLVDGNIPSKDNASVNSGDGSSSKFSKTPAGNQSEVDVKLRPRKRRKYAKMTGDLYIGSQIIPLSKLPSLKKAIDGKESVARIEQWFELEAPDGPSSPVSLTPLSSSHPSGKKRNPSILIEINFSTLEALDESEDEMDDDDDDAGVGATNLKASFARRASHKIRSQLKAEEVSSAVDKKEAKKAEEEPVLQPGVIDFVCVVGARDIGDQKADDGASGWVNSVPECCILEQFPSNDEFHQQCGRNVCLPNKVEWFCFPEGCRLWRGTTPPNLDELNLKRFSASSPANIATSIASFDACLGCTTSFSWFVISSNSDEYGSENVKTYGAVIRFFVPAPTGIDRTQDDFAQAFIDPNVSDDHLFDVPEGKRLWVPIGICLTSSIPIIGTMEAMLLRLCEALSANGFSLESSTSTGSDNGTSSVIHQELASLIVNYQRPIPGVVHCSVPFLQGDRFHLALPPRGGLPALPHGNAVASVCRLLGADGLNFMLAAMLTECKILIHSDDIANLCLVSEVLTALIYPFMWSLPYIPVLPAEMMEFIEAPLSFLLGVPTCNIRDVDPLLLEDIVVVDLDKDFSTADYNEARHQISGMRTKTPTPLPATVSSNISKAVYRLLRAEEEAEDETCAIPGSRSFPRMEPESQVEREFRVAVAMEICGLLRGYQDCLVYAASSQPVFNTDRFLQIAPALFEEQRTRGPPLTSNSGQGQDEFVSQYVLSPRSRRFMSLLVNCQHFHQFLETLESDRYAFFHEIMTTVNTSNNVTRRQMTKRSGHVLSLDFHKNLESLCTFLQKMEDSIPNYRVQRDKDDKEVSYGNCDAPQGCRFPRDLLQQIVANDANTSTDSQGEGVRHISLEYLMELEKNPWRYQCLFQISVEDADGNSLMPINRAKVKLRDAIGERRYRAWKLALEQEKFEFDDMSVLSEDTKTSKHKKSDSVVALDLNSLFTSATVDLTSVSSSDNLSSSGTVDSNQDSMSTSLQQQRRVADAKDRDILRRCLERALASTDRGGKFDSSLQGKGGRDLVSDAEFALRNPTARKFLLSVLNKRSAAVTQQQQQQQNASPDKNNRRSISASGASKLETASFEILLRLACTALDACMEAIPEDFDTAYALLKLTAGIYTITGDNDNDVAVAYMTQRLGLHPIYANLGVWERVKDLHLSARHEDSNSKGDGAIETEEDEEDDEYEAAVATLYEMLGYGIPAEELARFASRVSEKNGWFQSERGHTLMLLARRLSVRREQGSTSAPTSGAKKSDIELMNPSNPLNKSSVSIGQGDQNQMTMGGVSQAKPLDNDDFYWIETNWCHPAAQSTRRLSTSEKSRRPGTQNLLNMLDEQKLLPDAGRQNPKHMKRSAVTSMAYLGSSVVVTGGLDGGVFMARRVLDQPSPYSTGQEGLDNSGVHGVHLDWGSSGSRYTAGSSSTSNSLDGEYGVGAVSCLAATHGYNSNSNTHNSLARPTQGKGVTEPPTEEDLLDTMEGCKVVAGTTCGDLRVWTIKDVYSAVFYSNHGDSSSSLAPSNTSVKSHRTAEGVTSKFVSGAGKGPTTRRGTDFAAGSSLTRLKFSLRGRALSGHRGGVSCIDVPSSVYRPDSIISGGADGLIKLWSLRSPGAGSTGRRGTLENPLSPSIHSPGAESPKPKAGVGGPGPYQSGDALSILSGHGGRILCVKTAWHGDRLLSGGADRTVRVWDLATGGGGKCLHCLSGHFGWVTKVQYWGPNTIISSSTDRSIALWDARVRNTPLFSLRHHYSPISDVLVGSRTDPIMISAASDGTVAAWDFRALSGSEKQQPSSDKKNGSHCQVVRNPPGRLYLHDYSKRQHISGPVLLSRGPGRGGANQRTVFCVGSDAIIREWDYQTGDIITEHPTGHCDLISNFSSLQSYHKVYDSQLESNEPITGTITTSFDGTVRLRTLARREGLSR